MGRLFALLLMATPASAADLSAPKLPVPYTCEDVRFYVSQHGKIVAWAWARLHGYTHAQIVEARKCLHLP